ncbi:thiol reductant ABC exporter subunit CydD [Commensalibacter oyaizuii]|uniref:Thiol reductant ABC exporter subunit CydD n=1 Tax=Commensalibacter oyaizuii TaxID=3043873 RepID=A0ABT6Q345_9PROT|nr:thiol reductant ABC exporter subunit CydD [Commensalibacter sp. TBRC 16381]MDI2091532.1 thiol reductant ABC exporter subunit CydD [Commensalibacter sp. TBRC 16381]
MNKRNIILKDHLQLKNLAKISQKWLILSVILGSVAAVCLVGQFVILGHIVDNIIFHSRTIYTQYTLIFTLLLFLLGNVFFKFAADLSSTHAGLKLTQYIQNDLQNYLLNTGPIAYKNLKIGEMVTTLTEGIDALLPYFARYIPNAAMMVVVPIIILIVVASINTWSFIALAITGPLIPIFMVLVGYSAQRIMNRQWAELSLLSGHFLDMLKGLKTLRLFGRTQESLIHIEKLANKHRTTTLSVMKVAFLSSAVLEFFSSLSIAVIAVIFGTQLLEGTVNFRSAFLVLLLAPEFFMPLRNFSASYHARQNANAAVEQLQKIYELPAFVTRYQKPAATNTPLHSIHCKQLTVKTFDGQPLLQNISCQFLSNHLNVLTGKSGAGKTSLLNTILGFIPISSGNMTVLNTQGEQIGFEDIHVAWVPQQPYLMFGTIQENLTLGCSSFDLQHLRDAAEQANILSFIDSLPAGFDTHVGERGGIFSAGQLRRLVLARALYRNPDLLILDEPTAGLDPTTSEQIINTIRACTKDRVVIVSTHNLQLAAKSDALFRIDQGSLVSLSTNEGTK